MSSDPTVKPSVTDTPDPTITPPPANTPDTDPLRVEQLRQGASWVQERIKQGGRVLIHCEHGVGRSVLLACAVLVYGGMKAQDALNLVQAKRWQAAPNQRQVARLKEFEDACRAELRA